MASKTIIEELVSKLGFEIDTKNLDGFHQRSERIKTTITRIATVATAAGAAIVGYTSKLAIATDAQVKFSRSIGESHDTIQELRFAAEREGASLQSLQSSLLALSQRISEASRGEGEGIRFFGMLNVDIIDRVNGGLKTASQLLEDIAASAQFQRLGPGQQAEFLQRFGISPDMLLLMQKGREHIIGLRQEARRLGLVTEETAKRSEEWQDELSKTRFMIRTITTNIAGELVPTLIDLNDRFVKWFMANKKVIKQKLEKVINGVAKAISFAVKNMKLFLALLTAIVAVKFGVFIADVVIAVRLLGGAITALNAKLAITNALMFAIPAAILAAIAAVALLAQDFAVFMRGGDSLTGRFIDAFGKIGSAIRDAMVAPIDDAINSLKSFFDLSSNIGPAIRHDQSLFPSFIGPSALPPITINPTFNISGDATGDAVQEMHKLIDGRFKNIIDQAKKNADSDDQ